MLKKSSIEILKSPVIAGFFSLVAKHVLLLLLLQWIARFIFLLQRNAFSQLTTQEIGLSFWHGMPLDLAMVSYCMLFLLPFIIWQQYSLSGIPTAIVKIAFLIFSLYFIIISVADAELYRVWGSKFNRQALQYLEHPGEAIASSSEAKAWKLLVWIAIVVSVLWFFFYKQGKSTIQLVFKWWQLPVYLLMAGLFVAGSRGGLQTIPISQSSAFFSNKQLANLCAVNSGWNGIYYLAYKAENTDPDKYLFDLKGTEFPADYFGADSEAAIPFGAKSNVVLVVLESFSAFTSDYYGGKLNFTPFLDSISQSGWSFVNAYAQGDRTDKGLAAIVSGWPGQPWQSILNEPDKAAKLPSVARELSGNGYTSAFVYGGDLNFANMKAFINAAGFKNIVTQDDFESSQLSSKWGAHDGFTAEKLLDICNQSKQPFFNLWLTLSSHEPYDVPGYNASDSEKNKFLKSVQYTDACLRDFIQKASKQPWFENTVFVFVADHGRNFGLPDMEYFQPAHFRVPLLFWGPGLKSEFKGIKVQEAVSQTDIATTLVNGIGIFVRDTFQWSRNLAVKTLPDRSFYVFNNGFGYVNGREHVVWENNPPRTTELKIIEKNKDSMLLIGKSLQYNLIKKYKKM